MASAPSASSGGAGGPARGDRPRADGPHAGPGVRRHADVPAATCGARPRTPLRRTEGVDAVDAFWPVHQALAELEQERNRESGPAARPLGHRVPAVDRRRSTPGTGRRRCRTCSWPTGGSAWRSTNRSMTPDGRSRGSRGHGERAGVPWLHNHPVEVEWWGGGVRLVPPRPRRATSMTWCGRAHAIATDGSPLDAVGRTVRERPPVAGGRGRHPCRPLRPRPHRPRPRRRRARGPSTRGASWPACSPSRRSRSAAWPDNRSRPAVAGGGSGSRSAQPLPAGTSPRRPAWKSSKACWISARVFMTNGP